MLQTQAQLGFAPAVVIDSCFIYNFIINYPYNDRWSLLRDALANLKYMNNYFISFLSFIITFKIIMYSKDNQDLQTLWKELNPNEQEYIQNQVAIKWIKSALQKNKTLTNLQQSMDDLSVLIKKFLQQSHKKNEQEHYSIKLSYPELVEFLNWMAKYKEKEQKDQKKQPQYNHQHAQNWLQAQKQDEKIDLNANSQNKEMVKYQLQEQIEKKSLKNKNKSMVKPQRKQETIQQQNDMQQTQNVKQIKVEEKQDDQLNENAISNPNEFNIQNLSKKYKEYLKIIFQHYCKISYGSGQDTTFQQIKHKTTIITINKFMIFCKDFEIHKISEVLNRNYLIQVFKKHSQCYKQMSFQQFCEAIKKLATVGFNKQPQQKKENIDSKLLSAEMIQIFEFFEISTPKKFKQKMKKLNIQYRIGNKTNAQLKVIPDGYRFKFTSNNGKNQGQIKQQLQQRKQHRSQRKILLQQNPMHIPNDLSFRKRVVSKNGTSIYQSQDKIARQVISEANSQKSTNILNKILIPFPPSRLVNLPPNAQKNNNIHTPQINPHQPQAIMHNPNENLFKKHSSYAQIHKIKQNDGYSRKSLVNKSLSKQSNGHFKLNSIVEEARQQVHYRPQGQLSDQFTESIGTNSRQQSLRAKNYDLNKINHKIQIINERNRRDRQIQEQLEGLLDLSNDEDQFLKQHLQREKKNEIIAKKLSLKMHQVEKIK